MRLSDSGRTAIALKPELETIQRSCNTIAELRSGTDKGVAYGTDTDALYKLLRYMGVKIPFRQQEVRIPLWPRSRVE